MNLKVPDDLIHANFFFIDIVGLSNPNMSTNTQSHKIKYLNNRISECVTFRKTPKDELIILPTGDGMAIGFKRGIDRPMKLAIEIQQKLDEYNKNANTIDQIFVRIGCHSGNVFVVKDLLGNQNYWGPGLILCRRIMDLGESNHILLSSSIVEDILEVTDEYNDLIHKIPDYKVKHDVIMDLYSVYGPNFGNKQYPKRIITKQSEIVEHFDNMQEKIIFDNVEFNLILRQFEKGTIEQARTYNFVNTVEEPIYEIRHGIVTKVKKTFDELNVHVYDETNNHELKITKIDIDRPYENEFTIKFKPPAFQGDRRSYTVKYTSEEPQKIWENHFLINSKKFRLSFVFPAKEKVIDPYLYVIQDKTNEKKNIDKDPEIRRGVNTIVTWNNLNGISKNDIVILEW